MDDIAAADTLGIVVVVVEHGKSQEDVVVLDEDGNYLKSVHFAAQDDVLGMTNAYSYPPGADNGGGMMTDIGWSNRIWH